MGSDLATLRSLLVGQIDVKTPDVGTNPSITLINKYINLAIREITREQHPEEMKIATPTSVAVVAGTNSASYPTTLYIPDMVYLKNNAGKYKELRPKSLKWIINLEGQKFFDGSNPADGDFFCVRGGKIIVNKYFLNTDAAGLLVYGMQIPTVLVNDVDMCDLTSDWDLAIAYKAAVYFYQRDDDLTNQQKYEKLYAEVTGHLLLDLDFNESDEIEMDPYTFSNVGRTINDPGVYFNDGI